MAATLSSRRAGRQAAASWTGEIPDGLRIGFMVAALLLVWVRLTPLTDLTTAASLEVAEEGALGTQLSFSLLGVAVLAIVARVGFDRLKPLATLPFVAMVGWMAVSTLASVSPALSLRRMILLAVATAAAAAVPLAARNARQFANVLAGTALGVLAICFAALVVVPHLAMHTALDLREPEHAGAWRGLFAHKNEAGALCVVFVFIGLFTARQGERLLGIVLVGASLVFLAGSQSKTAIALAPAVVLVTSLTALVRGPAPRAILLLGPVALLLLVTLGSVVCPPVRAALGLVLPDVTFTGRTDLWEFAWENIQKRPLLGWGYGAFWRTEAIMFGGSEAPTWATSADQAHNGYLDVAIFMGLPGLALAAVVLVLAPFRDVLRAADRAPPDPAGMFFLRLWSFGLAAAPFESVFFDGNNSIYVMFAMSVFSLRFLAAREVAR